jgi:hypothetical protein
MNEFVTLIHRAADGTYRVSFADFPNVMAAGQTLDVRLASRSRRWQRCEPTSGANPRG